MKNGKRRSAQKKIRNKKARSALFDFRTKMAFVRMPDMKNLAAWAVICLLLAISGVTISHIIKIFRDAPVRVEISSHALEFPTPRVSTKPATLDRASLGDKMKLDKFSMSVDHIKSNESVAGGFASATSSTSSIRVPVMIYHSVRPYYPGENKYQDDYDVTPELLDQELAYLESIGATTTTFKAVRAAMDEGRPLPNNPVILSFDDGWENQYRNAFEVLKRHNAVGTFYIYTSPISKGRVHFLNWDQVIEMDRAGMEIGGHSRTHPLLTKILDPLALDREILWSKKYTESKLGHEIETFAYPFGYYNARVLRAVERAGYKTARTVYKGVWVDPEHRLEMRGELSTDDIRDFKTYVAMDLGVTSTKK